VDGPQKFVQNHQRQETRPGFFENFIENRTKNKEMRAKIKSRLIMNSLVLIGDIT
jgi:hypothetical protein